MTVTEPCVSLTTGTLSPDQRVNYAYGMVLGLDEFLQEQLHRLSHERLHERGEHGYGTVSGLAVDVTAFGTDDYQVTVSTGIGVDQFGREFVVRCDQCARLGAWLAAEEQRQPGIVRDHLGPSGELAIYVVGSYAECLDAMVPLPGQPCSTSGPTMTPSRVRDAWDIRLTWDRPAMPRWDSDRRLARLLDGVEVVAGLPASDSDEPEIIQAVEALADLADDGPSDLDVVPPTSPSGPVPWRLPLEDAPEALDRILTVWVTRVRPLLYPDLVDPDVVADVSVPTRPEDAAILLSTLDVVPGLPFDTATPVVSSCAPPDDEGRPFLLHTQLIQELRRFGDTVALPPAPTPPAEPIQLVTLAAGASGPPLRVTAWFHLDQPVRLPRRIEAVDEKGVVAVYATSPADDGGGDFTHVWNLVTKDRDHVRDRAQLAFAFAGDQVKVGDDATTLADVQRGGVTLLDADTSGDSGDLRAYTTVHLNPEVEPAPEVRLRASHEFVDHFVIAIDRINAAVFPPGAYTHTATVMLWFHPRVHGTKDDATIVRPVVRAYDDLTGSERRVKLTGPLSAPLIPNSWGAVVDIFGQLPMSFVRMVFFTEQTGVKTPAGDEVTLAQWIKDEQILYEGWNEEDATITKFFYVAPFDVPDPSDEDRKFMANFRDLDGFIGDIDKPLTLSELRRRADADLAFLERNR